MRVVVYDAAASLLVGERLKILKSWRFSFVEREKCPKKFRRKDPELCNNCLYNYIHVFSHSCFGA